MADYLTAFETAWRAISRTWKPPPTLRLSQWADRYATLSPESSAQPGRWRTLPYQKALLDAMTEPRIERVTVMKSARIGYTKIINHLVGYSIHQDPCPIMVVQPTIDDAEGYSKDEIAPMLRDTTALQGLVADPKSRDSGNTILKKSYPGGTLTLVGANSPRGFRRLTIKRLIFDEVDGYPPTAGTEGDQISLGIMRTQTFWDRKIVLGSTPTVQGASRIEDSFRQADAGYCYLPCPHCGAYQVLKWPNLVWPEGRPQAAAFACSHCGALIEHRQLREISERHEWRGQQWRYRYAVGEFEFTEDFTGHIGFHLWAAYSYNPNAHWGSLAAEFLAAKDYPDKLRTFVNTVLGETWEERGERTDAATLATRRENYDPQALPIGVLALTAGVDVQDNRLEIEVVGWGQGEESWGAQYLVLSGDPAKPDLWRRLDQVLLEGYRTEDGRYLRIRAACVDSGGHHTHMAYQFCTARLGRHIYAIKGRNGPQPIWPKRASKSKKYSGQLLRVIGVDTAKDVLYSRWQLTEPGPGYCHFPVSYDEEWFRQATVEKRITRTDKRGVKHREWHCPKNVRNEAGDCRCYAYTALVAEQSERHLNLAVLAGQVERLQQESPPTEVAPRGPIVRTRRQSRSNYLR